MKRCKLVSYAIVTTITLSGCSAGTAAISSSNGNSTDSENGDTEYTPETTVSLSDSLKDAGVDSIIASAPISDTGNTYNSVTINYTDDADKVDEDSFALKVNDETASCKASIDGNVITVTFDDLSYSDEIAISYKNDGDSLEITNDNIDFDYCEADEFLYGKNDTLSYRYYVPDDTDDELPLVLVLHGAGITGDDNELQLLSSDNATHFASDSLQSDYPCYVLAPQLPNDYVATDESPTDEQSALGWTDPAVQKAIIQTINELAEKYSIDMDRIYITGHSMGGLGVWGFITSYPDYFAAAAPISGLWNDDVSMLTDLPIWVFHGQNDPLVPIANEQDSVEKIEALGNPNIKWTVYSDDDLPDMGEYSAHMANIPTYNRADFNEWLFSHVKISD